MSSSDNFPPHPALIILFFRYRRFSLSRSSASIVLFLILFKRRTNCSSCWRYTLFQFYISQFNCPKPCFEEKRPLIIVFKTNQSSPDYGRWWYRSPISNTCNPRMVYPGGVWHAWHGIHRIQYIASGPLTSSMISSSAFEEAQFFPFSFPWSLIWGRFYQFLRYVPCLWLPFGTEWRQG